MAYDRELAERVRRTLAATLEVTEKAMMGGLVFMVDDKMCCGVTGSELMVRVGPAARDEALAQPHVWPMEIGGGRQPKAFVRVGAGALSTDAALVGWVERGVAFARTLNRPVRRPRQAR